MTNNLEQIKSSFFNLLQTRGVYTIWQEAVIASNKKIDNIFNNNPNWWIDHSFAWGTTQEGYEFWREIQQEWQDIYDDEFDNN